MKNLMTSCLAVALLVCVGLACKLTGLIPGKSDYFQGDSAQKAAAAIREKIGKPFNVNEVFIDKSEFRVHAQDPENPKNLDEYKYIGGFVTGPNPVKLDGMSENLEKSTFPFDEINFAAIPEFTNQAIEKSGIEGAKIYRLTFQRGFAIKDNDAGGLGNAYWKIEIEGERENTSAVANPQGKFLGVDLSQTSKAKNYQLLTTEELGKAQDELKKVLGANTQISEIVLYENILGCSTPNPQNPGVQDSYQFGINGVTNKGLVKLPTMSLPNRQNFSFSDFKLADAVTFIEKTRQRLEMPEAKVSAITIRRENWSTNKNAFQIIWGVGLKKGVTEGNVNYDNDGNEIFVYKNGKVVFAKK